MLETVDCQEEPVLSAASKANITAIWFDKASCVYKSVTSMQRSLLMNHCTPCLEKRRIFCVSNMCLCEAELITGGIVYGMCLQL